MNNTTSTASAIAKLSESGNYQKAAEMAASERAEHGSTVEGAALLARRAKKRADPRLVGLALCLCPEIQSAPHVMAKFALLAGIDAVYFCAAHAEGLRQMMVVAKTMETEQEVKPRQPLTKKWAKPVKLEVCIVRIKRSAKKMIRG